MSEVYYKIIHYKGGLSEACMQDFDEPDYDIASRRQYEDENEAIAYGKQLAFEQGLKWYGGGKSGYLD